jgi:STE24 endopeptidase
VRVAGAEGPARLRIRSRRTFALVLALLAGGVLWALAAHALWHSSVPSGLRLPHTDPRSYFSSAYLHRSSSYERFLDIDNLLGSLTLLIVLALYAWRGDRLMRESAAGRIGTGMMLGMLGFAVVWIAEIPFDLAAVWWERRHGVSHQGYLASVLEGFAGLGGKFLFVSLALLIAMGFAGVMRRWWWAAAAPLFAALALLSTFLSVYLVPNTHQLKASKTSADVRQLARIERIPGTHAEVQDVSRFTTAPNAESVGFGPTRRVILWDTLLDGRFDRREVRVVVAHELGHLAHHHPLKRVGWLALFLIPAAALVALFTRRRGGLARPEAVPLALFVFVALQVLSAPLTNIVSRREEAEADWSALRATHDPGAARGLFRQLAITSLANPDPPTWSYVLDSDHPTIVQRIAMVEAWRLRTAFGSASPRPGAITRG